MLEYFKRNSQNPAKIKEKFKKSFFSDSNHHWIVEDRIIRRSFKILLDSFDDEKIQFFIKYPTFFIPCQAHLSCAIGSTKNQHLILVFPELIKLLKSASSFHAVAILAHEMGHIYYQHTEQKIDTLTAQIEADDFAFKLGFGEELQEVLLDYVHSIDCRVRISKLTSKLLTKEYSKD